MKKFKILPIFVAFSMITTPYAVFAQAVQPTQISQTAATEAKPVTETEEESKTVILTYEEALELALDDMIAITDMEIAIRDLQVHRIFFRDELRRIDSGRGTLQTRAMEDMLRDISEGITAANEGQFMLEQATANAMLGMQMGIANIANPNAPAEEIAALQATLTGLFAMSTPNLSGTISQLQEHQAELQKELNRLNKPENKDEMRREVQRNLNEFDRQTESLKMAIEQTKLSVELGMRALIGGLADMDRVIESLQAGLELQEAGLNRMTILHQVGMLSTHDLNAARHGLNQSKTQLDDLLRSRQTLMQNLNTLLGQPLTQNTIIEFEKEFYEISEDLDLEEIINETITMRNLKLELDRASDARWVNTGVRTNIVISDRDRQRAHDPDRITTNLWSMEQTDEDEEIEKIRTRIALQEAVERAQSNYEQTARQIEASIVRAFTELDALDAQYETLQSALERAEENLEVAQTNLNLGLVTQFDVDQARFAVEAAERDIEGVINQKWLLAFRLENPTLLQ